MRQRLHLIRHPPPQVESGICYGSSDLPLKPEPLATLIAALIQRLPPKASMFYSPLQRCRLLALPLAAALGNATPTPDARLLEMHFGTWEMRHWDVIGKDAVDAWAQDMVRYQPGGGESVLQMATRVRAFYDDVLTRADGETIVVCHAGTIRLLAACQLGLSLPETALHAASTPHSIAYGELTTLELN
ncbi:histidine phosphatase family protein [Herbaspirillum sp. RTI4]|uniref:histidine phosphatase family protein n=1 Tax=Herbaspirillum sp. RTI4 TaxID=3048640 RepID=UPI002AB49906|nr:histidine phosphatase family protein [Herbaspirillum sp. RTI4]MDY7579551.1 histidine phosphatase family protein [Herbaspirillum sp. RTI4]MEA9981820.1 histidine phosphatase family protein [Herbaspirillum sp. RTI4]